MLDAFNRLATTANWRIDIMGFNVKKTSAAIALALLGGCAGGGGNRGDVIGDTLPEFLLCAPLFICGAPQNAQAETPTQSAPRFIAEGTDTTGLHYDTGPDGTIQPGTSSGASARQVLLQTGSNREFLFLDTGSGFRLNSEGRALPGQPGLAYALAPRSDFSPFVDASDPAVSRAGPATVGVVANPYQLGWSYQSFGIWNSHETEKGVLKAINFGQTTPASALPTSGAATFKGKLAGFYVSPGGEGSIAAANVTVNADFNARSLGFASNGTTLTRNVSTVTAAPHLDLGGTLTYSPGSNSFTGTIRNAGGTMSGASNGRFYGPSAQELGGVFTVKSPGTVETLTGAYGAKR